MNYKKKKSKKNIIIAACAVAVFAIATFLLVNLTGDNKGYRTISVVDISGTVSVVKDGIEYSAYPGMILQEGHEIVTAANSYVRMVLDDDKYVKLESGSRLVFETLGLLGSNKTRLNLERGSLTSEIVKPLESDAQYVVVAPNAVLSVRGTFFRVDLNMAEDGEIMADVMTYGGQVASQRIMPTGDVVEEEVLIDAGFKASINMDTDDTVYVMQTVEGSIDTTGDGVANLAPIMIQDIPDDDMVDIFFAAENGHELFVSAEEAKEDIEVRGINLEEKTSVYALAETIKAEEDKTVNLAGQDVIADDSKPLARVEETPEEEEVSETTSETKIQNVVSVLTDGDGQEPQETLEEPHVHVEVSAATKDEHSKCSECGEVLSVAHTFIKEETKAASCENVGENTYTCSCGYSYTEEIEAIGHSPVVGGVAEYHEHCANCGMVISDNTAHTFTEEIVKVANCTENGEKKYTCSCGYSYTEEIEATGHSAVAGATACQTVCSTCGITLSTSHSYTSSVTTEATCTTAGVKTYVCGCGHSYAEEIAATGHTEVSGATADCHVKCSVCGATITDGTGHSYTESVTTEATCSTAGVKTYTCNCGYSYTEEIVATGHTETTGGAADCHAKCSVCGATITDGTGHSYTESVTTEATCTTAGVKTYTCGCGYSYTEEIASTGHTETTGGVADCHAKCSVCGATITGGSGHSYTESVTTEATCTTAGVKTYTCGCGYSYTEEIPATGHTEVAGATADCHVKCSVCKATITDGSGHSYTESVITEASCTTAGEKKYTCDCGYSYTEEIVATGHTEAAGATADCHAKCSVCKATITDGSGHSYTESVTTEASCTTAGEKKYTCDCGYSYTKEIPVVDHTEVIGGTADCHSKCGVCGTTIEDENGHSYTESITTEATCTTAGLATYTCGCGYEYTEEIEALGHEGTGTGSTTCKHCGEAMLELNATNFPDTAFLAYVKANFNTVTTDDEILLSEEVDALTACTEVDISDGAYTDLTGIEYFTALTTLNCSNNSGLTGIPTSTLTNLTTLNITNCTSLSSVDLAACSNLTSLTAEGCTSLKEIDASGCPELTFLDADGSGVEIVNVNGCTKITTLSNLQLYPTNSLVELHAQGVPAISGTDLGFSDRATLEVIDFSGCTDMTTLNLSNCPALKIVNLSGCTNLETLNLTDSTAITELNISGTKLTGLDVSGCADLTMLTLATGLTSLDISGCTSLTTLDTTSLTALTTLVADESGLTSLDVTACTNIAEISVHTCTALTEINASGCTQLTAIQHADCSSLSTVNISGCTAFKAVSINSLTAIETYNASNCTSLTSFKAETGGSTLKTLELSGCTSLTELVLTAATDLITLKIGQCKALTSLDISMLTNLEVFYANSAGIKTLSGNSTCLDFSSNPNLTEMQVNEFTSFTEINLTANTKLEKFVYLNMPMQTVDLSNCVSLWNFQVSGCTKITSLDFSNCPDMIRLYVRNTSTIKSINISGCTKIWDVKFDGSNNISSANLTNAGTAVEDGNSLVFVVSSGSTTATTIQNAEGWNPDIMRISN